MFYYASYAGEVVVMFGSGYNTTQAHLYMEVGIISTKPIECDRQIQGTNKFDPSRSPTKLFIRKILVVNQ